MDPQTVNAAAIYRQTLYCGTDGGLTAVNSQGLVIRNALTEAVGDKRVRCLLADSRDQLWVCTYGVGLLCWAGHGQPLRWTREEGAAGDYVRCLLELPDGTMAVGGSEGLTFVQNGRVVNTITGENGLKMTQILTMALGEDGTIYAGSDGSGIYMIKEGKVVDTLDQSDGLSSLIVLRLVPYREGFFAVTSNALNFLEGNEARVLDKFPYFNNFDMVFRGDKAWVLASGGLFRVDPEELLAQDDQPLHYELFNHRNGFRGSLTANAWTCVDTQNRLYLCSNLGVQRIDLDQTHRPGNCYKLAIRGVTVDGNPLLPKNGTYRIGAGVDGIEARAAVYNYELEDLRLRFYLDGLDQPPAVFLQSELAPISYYHIPHGSYNLRLQLLDEEGGLLQELVYPVVKEARMWEYTYFHIYLLVVSVWVVIFATWIVITVYQTARRKRELEVMSRQLTELVEEQTSQILSQSRRMTDLQQHTIEGMATLIESRDGSTGAHVRNTGVYARMLAEELRRRGMYSEEIDEAYEDRISRVAPLHDVGKIKVSDLILNKPCRLTPEEYEIMKTHAAAGGEIIGQIMSRDMEPEMLQMARDITTCHHERWDGKGYPLGRKGTEIPLCARIMAVADVFDALSSKRVYKQAMDLEAAMADLEANAGTQFQAELVVVFTDLLPQIRAYLQGQTESEG